MNAVLQRGDQNAIRTLGALLCMKDSDVMQPVFSCQTLELPWLGNKHSVSCIPAGTYLCVLKFSPIHGKKVYWITNVPGRDDVEIHWGNFVRDTKGCVLLGMHRETDSIDNSVVAFNAFMTYMDGAESFTLQIIDPPAK